METEQENYMYGEMDGSVTITFQEYDHLKEDSKMLRALSEAGVDQWEGFDLALDIYKAFKE